VSDSIRPSRNLKGTWRQAWLEFLGAVLFLLFIRWALFEPYVIPSGSMIPTFLIHDHILVNKFAYGIRVPFASEYLWRWHLPMRGDVVVFRAVDQPNMYLVKRVVGLPGETIMVGRDGTVSVDGASVARERLNPQSHDSVLDAWPARERREFEGGYRFHRDRLGAAMPVILEREGGDGGPQGPYVVPEGSLFVLGDNRDNSIDSRFWGFVPLDHVLGQASVIWLSCEDTLREMSHVCDPKTIRWNRIFKRVR
jgi:signal peptidase I